MVYWAKNHLKAKSISYLSNFAVQNKSKAITQLFGKGGKRIVHLANLRPQKDHKLWNKFRGACNTFFDSKKEYFATLDDRQDDNLKQKESEGKDRVFNFHTADLKIKNSSLICNFTGEGLLISDATAEVDNCLFSQFTDPLEYSNMKKGGIIKNSRFIDIHDDAIDLNQSSNVLIENNFLWLYLLKYSNLY